MKVWVEPAITIVKFRKSLAIELGGALTISGFFTTTYLSIFMLLSGIFLVVDGGFMVAVKAGAGRFSRRNW